MRKRRGEVGKVADFSVFRVFSAYMANQRAAVRTSVKLMDHSM